VFAGVNPCCGFVVDRFRFLFTLATDLHSSSLSFGTVVIFVVVVAAAANPGGGGAAFVTADTDETGIRETAGGGVHALEVGLRGVPLLFVSFDDCLISDVVLESGAMVPTIFSEICVVILVSFAEVTASCGDNSSSVAPSSPTSEGGAEAVTDGAGVVCELAVPPVLVAGFFFFLFRGGLFFFSSTIGGLSSSSAHFDEATSDADSPSSSTVFQ
jgi:hypothetical protein